MVNETEMTSEAPPRLWGGDIRSSASQSGRWKSEAAARSHDSRCLMKQALPNAPYKEGSSSLSRPITPPLAALPSRLLLRPDGGGLVQTFQSGGRGPDF